MSGGTAKRRPLFTAASAALAVSAQHARNAAIEFSVAQVPRLVYALLFVAGAAPAIYLALNFNGFFNSPDETARYLAAHLFAEHGTMSFQDEITATMRDAPVGPRGFVQHDGRAVPMYSPAHIVIAGFAEGIAGARAPLVLAAIPGLCVVLIVATVRRLAPQTSWLGAAAIFGSAPLWYWLGRVYLETSLFLLLFCAALWCFVTALATPGNRALRGLGIAALLLGATPAARLAEASLVAMVALIMLAVWIHRRVGWRNDARLASLHASAAPAGLVAAGFAVGLVPLFLINLWVYGSPFTTGYTLFYEAEFPERLARTGGALGIVLNTARTALIPQPIDLATAVHTAVYQVLLLVPLSLVVAAMGVSMVGKRLLAAIGPVAVGLLAITLLYLVISRSDPDTFLARGGEPNMLASLVRYWIPLHLLLVFLSVYAIGNLRSTGLAVSIAVVLVLSGMYEVWYGTREGVAHLPVTTEAQSERFTTFLDEQTEPYALIVAGSSTDKWAAPVRRTIGIWYPNSTPESLGRLADLMGDVAEGGRPVYLLTGPLDHPDILPVMRTRLLEADMHMVRAGSPVPLSSWSLWEVEPHESSTTMQEGNAP